jgi:hypothetical protein
MCGQQLGVHLEFGMQLHAGFLSDALTLAGGHVSHTLGAHPSPMHCLSCSHQDLLLPVSRAV